MSTRYVWEKFNRVYAYTEETVPADTPLLTTSAERVYIPAKNPNTPPVYNPASGVWENMYGNSNEMLNPGEKTESLSRHDWFYFAIKETSPYGTHDVIYSNSGTTYVRFYYEDDEDGNGLYIYSNVDLIKMDGKGGYQCGSISYGNVVSSSSGKYPNGGASGSYWYVYQGSDCIDPTAVSIPSEIKAGDTITAALTARANTYGGTITYTYSYSVDGGSTWVTAGSTTATSIAIAVPEDAEQFMVRAVAKDNYGFTSTTYVKSANVEVRRGAALLACIDGVLREITPTVMVDGVLRQLTAATATIDGMLRELGAG